MVTWQHRACRAAATNGKSTIVVQSQDGLHTLTAAICAYHRDRPLEEVTAFLGIEPDDIARKGLLTDLVPYPHDAWILDSAHRLEEGGLAHHVDWAIEILESRADAVRDLVDRGWKIDVHILWRHPRNWNVGLTLQPDQMAALGRLGASIIFIAWPADEMADQEFVV